MVEVSWVVDVTGFVVELAAVVDIVVEMIGFVVELHAGVVDVTWGNFVVETTRQRFASFKLTKKLNKTRAFSVVENI